MLSEDESRSSNMLHNNVKVLDDRLFEENIIFNLKARESLRVWKLIYKLSGIPSM